MESFIDNCYCWIRQKDLSQNKISKEEAILDGKLQNQLSCGGCFDYMDKINYQPVGLGNGDFPKNWITDRTGNNISKKNKYYDMYTFHYWLWKNKLSSLEDNKWVCFSTYRRFWKNSKSISLDNELKDRIIQHIPPEWEKYETILTEPTDLRNFKVSKMIKKGKFLILKKPGVLFNKNMRTIKFHFDVMHKEFQHYVFHHMCN